MTKQVDETERLFSSLYEELNQIDAKKQVITLSEFKQFLPLFQAFPDGKIPSSGSEEEARYKQLSHEYSMRVNIKSPVKLIDDVSKEVIAVLPPLFSDTKLMNVDQITKNANFHIEATHDFPGVAERAHKKLQAGFIISQEMSLDELQAVRKAEFHQELDVLKKLNPEKFNQVIAQFGITPPDKASPDQTEDDNDDILEFVVSE